MDLYRLALRNIAANVFKSLTVMLCALLLSGMILGTSLVLFGAGDSLELAISRLGADLIVVPEGLADRVETALLMGRPTQSWMPDSMLEQIRALDGVGTVSPQLYLATLTNASCCSVSNMFLIVYDPGTDFIVGPWMEKTLGSGLRIGEVIGGSRVFLPKGDENIRLYGYPVTLVANMEPTGTGLDQSLFLTMETAKEMARISRTKAEKPLEIPEHSISAAMVRTRPGHNPYAVALNISERIHGVTAIVSPDMFQSYRLQLTGLMGGVKIVLGLATGVSLLLIGLVFSLAANERRRESGVLRALGASRSYVFRSLVIEAGLLGLNGAGMGLVLTLLAVTLFRRLIMVTMKIPFLMPSLPVLALLIVGGLGWALLIVVLGAAIPAYRISRMDPSIAMRE